MSIPDAPQQRKRAGIVAAAAVPHAPQFLSRPDTEDLAQVDRVHAQLAAIGEVFRSKQADCVIVISNDHGDHFVAHSVPALCVHAGASADGSGLGLAIVKAIAERHGAIVSLGRSERLGGLHVTVRFPLSLA